MKYLSVPCVLLLAIACVRLTRKSDGFLRNLRAPNESDEPNSISTSVVSTSQYSTGLSRTTCCTNCTKLKVRALLVYTISNSTVTPFC